MVKSAYELAQLRRAAAILDQVHEQVPALLKPGMSELEVSAALEYRLRLLGHQGLVRVRNWDLEVFYGHVLSGVSGLLAAYTDTPSGGPGFSAAFPQGPSLKKLAPGEPISIDLAACVNGYVVDMTRMYALGSLPSRAWEAWEAVEELYRLFTAAARPGVSPGEIFHLLWDAVRARGLEDFFMGLGPDRVSFLAHGVGLELDEYPFITARFPYPLEADMVLAFEPKFFLPEIGMIGQEDTGRITPAGGGMADPQPPGDNHRLAAHCLFRLEIFLALVFGIFLFLMEHDAGAGIHLYLLAVAEAHAVNQAAVIIFQLHPLHLGAGIGSPGCGHGLVRSDFGQGREVRWLWFRDSDTARVIGTLACDGAGS